MFDIESYVARYAPSSETRFQRLLFLARHAPSQTMSLTAYRLLETQLKEAANDVMYEQVFDPSTCASKSEEGEDEMGGNASMEYVMESSAVGGMIVADDNEENHIPTQLGISYDASFTSNARQSFYSKLSTLETNLSTAQSHLSKDAIRIAMTNLAHHYTSTGRLKEGLIKYMRCKDYCRNTRQATDICWEICLTALHAKNYGVAKDHVTRLERSDPKGDFTGVMNQLQAMKGLLALIEGDLEVAAKLFLNLRGDFTSSHLISMEDVALYGGLLGLTTLDRNELSSLMSNDVVQERLDLVPSLKDAIRWYKRADYGKCLNLIQGLQEVVSLDLYLAPHAKTLLDMVRDKCICHYFSPYTTVSLETMRESFNFPSTDHVEQVLVDLMESKRIVGARIHVEDGTLSVSREGVERRTRRAMMRQIAKLGDGLVQEIEHLVLRQSCLEHGVEVKGEKGPKMNKPWAPAGMNWKGDVSSDEDDTPMIDLDRFNWA